MKTILFFVLLGLGLGMLKAQAPQKFNYQAIARDNNGAALANQDLDLRFTIHSAGTSGPIAYQETWTAVSTDAQGGFNLQIGDGTPSQGAFSSIPWGNDTYFLEVELRETGQAAYVPMGAAQLISVAYALYAQDVANKDDADADPGNELQALSIAGDTISLSSGGGQVVLPNDDDWIRNGTHLYAPGDSVGIGTNVPAADLHVAGAMRYDDGNAAEGRLLMSDADGDARWDTLVDPWTFKALPQNWANSGSGNTEIVVVQVTITLTKKSLVVANFTGHVAGGHTVAGIVFDGETLVSGSPPNRVYRDLLEASIQSNPSYWYPISGSRERVLEPGSHTIQIRVGNDLGNYTFNLNGASLHGYVIPFN